MKVPSVYSRIVAKKLGRGEFLACDFCGNRIKQKYEQVTETIEGNPEPLVERLHFSCVERREILLQERLVRYLNIN